MSACISVSSTAWTPCKMAAPWRPSRITSSTGSARGKSKITTDVGEEQEPEEEREAEAEKEEGGMEEEELGVKSLSGLSDPRQPPPLDMRAVQILKSTLYIDFCIVNVLGH